jgi:hypothetical protein
VVTFQVPARPVVALVVELAGGVLSRRLPGDVRRPEKKYA